MNRALVLAALLALPLATAHAEEPKASADGLSLRIYDLTALTAGRPVFGGESVGAFGGGGTEDSHPSLPWEAEERDLPLGGLDEVIELLKTEADPESWLKERRDAKSMGGRYLVVRHSPEGHTATVAAVSAWERRWMRTSTVEVRAVRLTAGASAPTSPEAWAALVASGEAGPGVSLAGFPNQQVSGFAGLRRAYVADGDITRLGAELLPERVGGLANLGLVVTARSTSAPDGDRAKVWIRAALAEAREWSRHRVDAGLEVETARVATITCDQHLDLPVGRWTLLDGSRTSTEPTRWALALRVLVEASSVPGPPSPVELPGLPTGELGPVRAAHIEIHDLQQPRYDRPGRGAEALPSRCRPVEPELSSPGDPLSCSALQDLVRESLDIARWGAEPMLDCRRHTLLVRGPERALEGVGRAVALLERLVLRRVEVEAEVLEAPAPLAVAGDSLLSEGESRALAAALSAGTATRLASLRLTSSAGARNHADVGTTERYLAQLNVEAGAEVAPLRTRVQPLLDGTLVDVHPHLASGGDAVATDVRFLRTRVRRPLRELATPLGTLQLPEVRTQRLRASLAIPLGKTGVVGSTVEDGRRTLLLLTPRLVRPGD